MKYLLLVLMAGLGCTGLAADQQVPETPQQLLQQILQQQQQQQTINLQRETAFLKAKAQQAKLLAEAKAALAQTQAENEKLQQTFDEQAESLISLKKTLKQRSGHLGELFGQVRQLANDVQTTLQQSLITAQYPKRITQLRPLSETKQLPTTQQLRQLWYELQREMTAAGEVTSFTVPVISEGGRTETKEVTRVGSFNVVTPQGYLRYLPDGPLQMLASQPSSGTLAQMNDWLKSKDAIAPLTIDPTQGDVLNILQQQPTWVERWQQGGVVGMIIGVLGTIGMLLGIGRLLQLMMIQQKVKQQLAQPAAPHQNNPLGRVLAVYHQQQTKSLDQLELCLDEAIMHEVPKLERWQGTVKLLAGVAPLMGLLGTVTGMIVTFQTITLFGTGDPKLMAAGISQALITTVLGLIAAIPLLFLHTAISSRSKALIQILDKQAAGLLAQQFIQDHSVVTTQRVA
ncbi:MotA/TolQ/ExbB proton channel family protein [Zooshikella harenae]|uniref:MotA/TolQ/ExbB proton channel family protein n=1 Tax=Zooshikella harenae TaxID=2827238 RepID=A0ABS5ZG19_9GAMM|nr:MotA/TolQ/ExbB proton channel family protein [Zooshikella harenae]MBU2712930.1 MotA/TolQ/ExbB proton channel family protein [Zooshikella harenae]